MTADALKAQSATLAQELVRITAASRNEENLRHGAENALETACKVLGITWTPFQLERTLKRGRGKSVRFADVTHGAVVIEYEPPRCFGGKQGERLLHARGQAEEYTDLLHAEEGRPLGEYVLVTWDGAHISFGHHDGSGYVWDTLQDFHAYAAERLLGHLRDDGMPLVHPMLLSERVGPTSVVGRALIPALFTALQSATTSSPTSKTKLLYTEWSRLFGQVVGDPSDRLKQHLAEIGKGHGENYAADPRAYLFALNTYIALVAKLVSAMALPNAAEDLSNSSSDISGRIQQLESGQLFLDAGITNMLTGDFFSWYVDDVHWESYAGILHHLVNTLGGISFDVTRKDPASTRDLFKGLYMNFAPQALRHALGEYYTPDWLASHALDTVGWVPTQSLLDPTCGSGTFVLEGLRRRLLAPGADQLDAAELLDGLHGMDLNPLAVLAARASIVVFLSQRLEPAKPVQLPVYLADAVNPAEEVDGLYQHRLQTEQGIRTFHLPAAVVKSPSYFRVMQDVRSYVDGDASTEAIVAALQSEPEVASLDPRELEALTATVATLVELHGQGWNGIWCSVLADRFAAGAVKQVDAVVGNPPWVKWSHLPADYAEFIKPRCLELGIFSTDTWVGGIESDISTVITYEAINKYCATGGVLGFFVTGTVFANESSQGFRRWQMPDTTKNAAKGAREHLRVELVEDFAAVAPFAGVSNHTTLLVIRRDNTETEYPLLYRVWRPPVDETGPKRSFSDSASFVHEAHATDLLAKPVPGSDAGPWLKGTAAQHDVWDHLFVRAEEGTLRAFRARKGVTTDANGIYFVATKKVASEELVQVTNDPKLGRRAVSTVTATIEKQHVYPLLRGAGVAPFQAINDPTHCVIVPQSGKSGEPDLPTAAKRTHQFLKRFQPVLETRASFKLYQKGAPFWSLWSTGPYTFSPWKVVWKEMSGGRFQAAYIGSASVHALDGKDKDGKTVEKVVIPDHKVYFVACETEDEAAFLTGFLNAPLVAGGINAYASALSLGTSVVEYLQTPSYDEDNTEHAALVTLSKALTNSSASPSATQYERLDEIVAAIVGIPQKVLDALHADGHEADEAAAIAAT